MKTRAVTFTSKGGVEIRELEVPPPATNHLQVRTVCSGISAGTESWLLRDLFTWMPTPFPCVAGYQRSGVVTAVGPGVIGWKVGDRAVALTGVWSTAGVAAAFGAHIELANVPAELAYPLPGQLDDIEASNAVVAQVGYNAANRAVLSAREWVLVYGDGLIGQCAAQAARARGARVIMVGHRAERLELAAQHSADAVINSGIEDVVSAVRKITAAHTVPVVLDSVQTPESQTQYIGLLEPGRGQIVYHGFTPGDHWADMGLLQQRELTTHFVSGWKPERMSATLGLMAGAGIRIRPLITHLVPFTQAPEMYRMILEKSAPFLGITLDWRT